MRFDREPVGIVEAVKQPGKQVGVASGVHAKFRGGTASLRLKAA
jgi:hypothetical protein